MEILEKEAVNPSGDLEYGDVRRPACAVRRRRGFTLIEVLVTLVASSIVLAAVYGAFLGSITAKRTCEEASRGHRLGRGVMTLLERDLTGAFRPREDGPALEGFSESAQGGHADRVEFVTTSDARRAVEGRGRDHCEVGYRTEPDPDAPGLRVLVRREAHGIEGNPFQGGTLEVLAEGVSSFHLEYLTGDGTWFSEWHGPGLPRAVRAALTLRRLEPDGRFGRETTFRGLIAIPAGRG